jgi:hypothetical protein
MVTGIAFNEGILYVLTTDTTAKTVNFWRALNPRDPDTAALAKWSYTLEEDVQYGTLPQSLKMSPDYKKGPRFWAIDTEAMEVNRITDPIALEGPTTTLPEDGATVKVNTESGAAYDVTFSWERYSDKRAINMDFQVASDEDFTAIIEEETIWNIDRDDVSYVVGPGQENASFNPGQTYYWRVRHSGEWLETATATEPAQDPDERHWNSPWSEVRSFTVEDLKAVFTISSPASGSYDVPTNPLLTWAEYPGAIGYELMLAEDPTFAIIDFSYNISQPFYKVDETLKYSTTYYWRVRGVTGEAQKVRRAMVVPAGPWMTGVFTTEAEPVDAEAVAPPEVTVDVAPPDVTVEVPSAAAPIPPGLLWAIVVIGAVLIIALIVLIVRTRRVA